jgi:hypothetical protein
MTRVMPGHHSRRPSPTSAIHKLAIHSASKRARDTRDPPPCTRRGLARSTSIRPPLCPATGASVAIHSPSKRRVDTRNPPPRARPRPAPSTKYPVPGGPSDGSFRRNGSTRLRP